MYFNTQEALSLTETPLKKFLSLGIKENLFLDYKETLSGSSPKEAYREFLKDITAFANSAGGDILIGAKEPAESLSPDEQLPGITDGLAIAQSLERLASASVDPRIPGLRIVPVPLATGKTCILVHIPPSLSRPHMVSHQGHRSFYIRHSESSFPMTTHEIRETVLTSASAEARARQYLEKRLTGAREILENKPGFLLQAMPVIPLESSWDVLDHSFINMLRGDDRNKKYEYFDLASRRGPVPSIDGLVGRDYEETSKWEAEVHRNGYVSALYKNFDEQVIHQEKRLVVHSLYCELFAAFLDLLGRILNETRTDLPYLIACSLLNARGLCLWTESRTTKFTEPFARKDIIWPELVLKTGEDPSGIADSLSTLLFNAFGLPKVIR